MPGRWNSEGRAVVYLSSTLSLAALEYLVPIGVEDAPTDLIAIQVEVPDTASMEEVDPAKLPDGWRTVPDHPECVAAGDRWIGRGDALLLRVPSALIPAERNVLLHPRHPHADTVRVIDSAPFAFDPRILA